MIIDVLTLFPESIEPMINSSILKRAIENDQVKINVHNFRDYSKRINKRVDDYSYGGGAGMIIELQPIVDCLNAIDPLHKAYRVLTSPVGTVYKQSVCKRLKNIEHLIIICGHYEGIDDRIVNYIDEKISIGDYILTGGEIAALAIVDSVVRLLPNTLGNSTSIEDESFEMNLLEYPQYTRPYDYEGYKVPKVLIEGNHEKIRKYRRYKSLEETMKYRPDLLTNEVLSQEDLKLIDYINKGLNFEGNKDE